MAGHIPGKSSEPKTVDGGIIGLMKTMNRDEVFEALSQGFCQHCEASLENRILQILNKRGNGTSLSKEEATVASNATPTPSKQLARAPVAAAANADILLNDGLGGGGSGTTSVVDSGLSEEQKEHIRFSQVGRKKDFVHMEKIDGRSTNVLKGLELHTKVFNADEQKKIVEYVYNLQRMGQKGQLRERTYTEPRKWMRGKGRVTIQFGCCYNYAVDKNGNPPGILRDEEVDPLPPLFKLMIKRMVRWHILPASCVPNSCIVNIYDEGDCIPPHIDHHDFLRPFCTVSFLTQCNILFGSSLKILSPGEFSGPASIPLPVGSVLILNGNGADIAKHCVPAVPGKRISITFRRMDESKLPYEFSPDPELLRIKPLIIGATSNSAPRGHHQKPGVNSSFVKAIKEKSDPESSGTTKSDSFLDGHDDFPPLGKANNGHDDFPPLGKANNGRSRR